MLCLTTSLTALSSLESRSPSFAVTWSTTKSCTSLSWFPCALHCLKAKSLSNSETLSYIVYGQNLLTLEIKTRYSATLSSGGERVGVKKETPSPPQGINNIHSYRGDRWETALPLPHKPYLLLQLFNFATPSPPFFLIWCSCLKNSTFLLVSTPKINASGNTTARTLHVLRKQPLVLHEIQIRPFKAIIKIP